MIKLKSREEISKLKKGGRILAQILEEVSRQVKPGVNVLNLEAKIGQLLIKEKAASAFLGFRDYPALSCLSVNNEVVHSIPRSRILKQGDLLTIDLGVRFLGLITDAAVTLPVGKTAPDVLTLLTVTKKALFSGIKKAKPGNRVGDISAAIEKEVIKAGLTIIKSLTGHGTGYELQEPPSIPNFGTKATGVVLREGMVLAIEPIVGLGKDALELDKDNWTVKTKDNYLTAHFEHTIAITKKRPLVLTK
ncbi:type I methionyl aminopeptidase [Candidatus Berkelbacteria bacterium]|nr:type I methionyl aminopeptidase [Candidatus Berkelbacteria bacterium]MBI2588277.1 type I methionyl aminopeptidase [Candidatus Berkelbacteria bacterium]MBI4030027.1 type I methionyl aminopeptidase [Candidatus Berkelbacteria bacterium]